MQLPINFVYVTLRLSITFDEPIIVSLQFRASVPVISIIIFNSYSNSCSAGMYESLKSRSMHWYVWRKTLMLIFSSPDIVWTTFKSQPPRSLPDSKPTKYTLAWSIIHRKSKICGFDTANPYPKSNIKFNLRRLGRNLKSWLRSPDKFLRNFQVILARSQTSDIWSGAGQVGRMLQAHLRTNIIPSI